MPRTAHIVIDARPINSSTGTVLQRLLPHLQRLDTKRRYTVVMMERDRGFWTSDAPNFEIAYSDVSEYSIAGQTRHLALLNRLRADLVWFFMPEQPLFYRGRTITMFHDFTMQTPPPPGTKRRLRSYFKMPLGRLVFWAAARKSQFINCPSEYTRQALLARYRIDPDKVRTIHNGAEVRTHGLAPYPHGYSRYLLYVGQFLWHKNLRRLCEAHQTLLDRHPGLGLILVGRKDAFAQAMIAEITERKMRNITFTDFLPDAQRDWLYSNAEAYVFPSLAEGFGLPGIEAMGYGAPVVSSNATCLPEIYGDAAAYFDPLDVDDMVRTIDRVLVDEEYRLELKRRGAAQAALYSYSRMAEALLAMFEEALSADKPTFRVERL